jgi:hypothetical protein
VPDRTDLRTSSDDLPRPIVSAHIADNDGDLSAAAGYLEMPLGLVQAAAAYYGAYPGEIDQWIELNEQDTAQAHAAFTAGQAAVRP